MDFLFSHVINVLDTLFRTLPGEGQFAFQFDNLLFGLAVGIPQFVRSERHPDKFAIEILAMIKEVDVPPLYDAVTFRHCRLAPD